MNIIAVKSNLYYTLKAANCLGTIKIIKVFKSKIYLFCFSHCIKKTTAFKRWFKSRVSQQVLEPSYEE